MKLKSEHLWGPLEDERGSDDIPVPRFVAMLMLDDIRTLRDALADLTEAAHVNQKSLDEYAATIFGLRQQLADCAKTAGALARTEDGIVTWRKYDLNRS